MATEANESSTEEQDEEQSSDNSGEKSQEQMAEEFEEQNRQRRRESKRRIGLFQTATTVLLVVIGLCCLYFGSIVGPSSHPFIENGLYALGALNLALALAMQIRKNWSRTLVLFAMPLTIMAIILTFSNTAKSSLLVCLLCIAVLFLMFRQPVLDEYDAPKE